MAEQDAWQQGAADNVGKREVAPQELREVAAEHQHQDHQEQHQHQEHQEHQEQPAAGTAAGSGDEGDRNP